MSSSSGECYELGDWGAGGVAGDFFWSDIDLVDCVR